MEISSYIISILLLDRLGRRYTLAGGFLVASVGLIVSLVLVELSDNNPGWLVGISVQHMWQHIHIIKTAKQFVHEI